MKTKLATAGLLIGALLLPVTAFSAAHTGAPKSPNETTAGGDTKPMESGKSSKRRSSQPVSDSVITTKVKAKMAKDKQVSAMNIEVKTVDGVVNLAGNAKSKSESSQAVRLAKSVKGVKKVQNDISVQ